MNALRRQYAAERVQITKDTNRHIGHLNTAISQTTFPEARDALRREKGRVYEAMRASHRYNRLCYLQQLEAIEDEYRLHLEQNPSKKQLGRMMTILRKSAEQCGQSSLKISLTDNRSATVTFD